MTAIDIDGLLKASKGASVPDGDYTLRVASAAAGNSQAGNATIKTSMEVVSGPLAGSKFPETLTFSDKTSWKTLPLLNAFGLSDDDLRALGDTVRIAEALVGRSADATVGHREWNGRTQSQISSARPATGGVVPPVQPAAPAGFPPAQQGGFPPAAAPAQPQYAAQPAPAQDTPWQQPAAPASPFGAPAQGAAPAF